MTKQMNSVKTGPATRLSISGRDDVSLRLIGLDDVDEFFKVMSIGGPNLDEYQYWDKGLTPEGIKAEVETAVEDMQKGKTLWYLIIDNHTQNIIGEVSFFDHDESQQTAHFGYLITAEFEGRGIVSAASKELIKYATNRWNLKKILLEIEVGNERSEHLAQKLGAQPTDKIVRKKGGDRMRDQRVWEIML